MEQVNFIEKLNELVAVEDLLSVGNEVNELKTKFEDYVLEEERKFQVSQLEAQDKGEEVPELDTDFGKEEFYNIFGEYKTKKKALIEARNNVEEENLKLKNGLIAKLKDVIENEENIGAAFGAFKEVQEKWKEVGDIPRKKRSDIQSEYSKLIEDFFYNIKIYKELKDHDFHRNKQLKEEVISKLKEIAKIESMKEVEQQIKLLQNEWDDIGPVPNEDWETLKDGYWTEVRSIYERINRFYEDKRAIQKQNIVAKEALVEETKAYVEAIPELNSVKDWDAKSKELIAIQKRWKEIGFGPRKENEDVWKRFRALCDEFFHAKSQFFEKVNEKFDAVAAQKVKLIEQAEGLKDSTNWKETSNKLIQLQKQWKQIGHSGKRNEQKLWRRFRGACDDFFNARTKHFSAQDEAYVANLTAKKEVLAEIDKLKLPADKKEALGTLKELASKFNAIGRVPIKEKDNVFKAFKSGMDKHYSALKLEGKEKDETMFLAKLDTLKASPDAGRRMDSLRFDLRKDIDKLKKEITLLENNLGFFANSKGADALRKDVDKKIKRAEDQIDAIKSKLKLIPNE